MNMRKWLFVFTIPVCSVFSAQTNLLENGGFEKNLSGNMWGNVFRAGPGAVERTEKDRFEGKYSMRLFKERGPGGAQLMGFIKTGDSRRVEFSFRYRTSSGINCNYNIGFVRRIGVKNIPILDTTKKPAGMFVRLKEAGEWTLYKRVLEIPASYISPETGMMFGFQVWGGQRPHEMLVDDVRFTPLDPSVQDAEKTPGKQVRVTVVPPKKELSYQTLPGKLPYSYKDGLIRYNGKPRFLVGNGYDLGAAQSTPAGLWLSKLQGADFIAMEGYTRFYAAEKENDLTFSVRPSYGNLSWYREVNRFGFLTEVPVGTPPFRWSPLKKYSREYPKVKEFHYDGGHGISSDPQHPHGLSLLNASRRAFLQYVEPETLVFELNREPGPNPSNQRILLRFRTFAKKKYGTLEEVNKVWRRKYKSWSEIVPLHLDSKDMVLVRELALRKFALAEYPEMYYDWLACIQEDVAENTAIEAENVRKIVPVPVSVDIRGHRVYTDAYCAYDPEKIDPLVDLFFIHNEYRAVAYNHTPYHRKTLHDTTVFPLFMYNFFRTNTRHPIWNSEDIVRFAVLPGSNEDTMKKNDIAQLHGDAWQFTLDERREGIQNRWYAPDFDDSKWSRFTIPGCWDDTKEFAGRSGWGWYRKTFVANTHELDFLDGSHKFYLYGKGISQSGRIWLNGHYIGEVKGTWASLYQFDVGRYLKFNQKNQITILVDGHGFKNGIRFYCHILRDDMIHTAVPFAEKQYRAMFWTYMMRGSSAVSVWSWIEDAIRPYLADIVREVNSVSDIVLPDLRNRKGRIAYLYSFLWGRGLPCAGDGTHYDHMDWYNALEFSGHRPDVYGEKNVLSVTPEQYGLLVVPYAKIVQQETFEHILKYIKAGGTAVITHGSLEKTFSRYRKTGIDRIAGIQITGTEGVSFFGEKPQPGAETKSTGVTIRAVDAKVMHRYDNGSPAVTEKQIGKGRLVFVAPQLPMESVMKVLMPYLPEPEVRITARKGKEIPLIERTIAGNAKRKVLYLFNWGGMDHELTVRIPRVYDQYHITNILGDFKRTGSGTYRVKINSQSPAVLLMEAPDVTPRKIGKISPERKKMMERVIALNREGGGGFKVLFPYTESRFAAPVGKEMFPYILQRIKQHGGGIYSKVPSEWTPEYLKMFKLVVLPETWSISYNKAKRLNPKLPANLKKYVEDGGSLLLMAHTARTANSSANMFRRIAAEFGCRLSNAFSRDSGNCAFGDPHQFITENIAESELSNGVSSVLLYIGSPLLLSKSSPLKPLVLSSKQADALPNLPFMAYAHVGKGKVFLSSDIMSFQPGRISRADNAALLVNLIGWLCDKKATDKERQAFRNDLFLETLCPAEKYVSR